MHICMHAKFVYGIIQLILSYNSARTLSETCEVFKAQFILTHPGEFP